MQTDRLRMYLAQRVLNNLILLTVTFDVVAGYILKRYQGPHDVLPFALLYLINIVVLVAVYRFWKLPVFEWDEQGFTIFGISPFTKTRGRWETVENASFKVMEIKKGKSREFFVIHFVTAGGLHRTDMVPVYMVGFMDKIKPLLQETLKRKNIPPIN